MLQAGIFGARDQQKPRFMEPVLPFPDGLDDRLALLKVGSIGAGLGTRLQRWLIPIRQQRRR